jgi:hypothetical protein
MWIAERLRRMPKVCPIEVLIILKDLLRRKAATGHEPAVR